MKKTILTLFVVSLMLVSVGFVIAAGTKVPGHDKDKYDQDDNGIPDAGVYVNGHYYSVYAYDCTSVDGDGICNSDWYWDLGDGRIFTSAGISSIDDLDQVTLTTCDYVINYRADFGNNPFMDAGWIQNLISCSGYDDNNQYNYFIVHESDPRYRGNPDWSIWGTWEYHGLTISHFGNLVRPINHVL